MDYLIQIQNGVDYIETNLDQSIDLSDVAKSTGMSQWHFQRMFKALTGETLKTYIRSRRLSQSLSKLLNPKLRIIEIAVEAGFESQESFTRAFQKAFLMTPGQFRKLGDKHLFMEKVQLNIDYLNHINKNLSISPEIYEQPEKKYIGMKTTYYGVDSEKNSVGEKLPALWQDFLPRLGEIKNTVAGQCYGIIQQTPEKTDKLEYYCVIEVSDLKFVPNKMVVVETPPQKYARFSHKGEVQKMDNTVNFIYSTWLINSNYQHTYGADIEVYGSEYHPTSDQSVTYYSIPICEK